MLPPSLKTERAKLADFYAARSEAIPPLPWQTFPPPFSGAQFVHRYLLLTGAAKAESVVIANAGSYTLPLDRPFPEGLGGTNADPATLRSVFARPVILQLGEADTDPKHSSLPSQPWAVAQGSHRFARGWHFFDTARRIAQAGGSGFAWRVVTVPGVGHSNEGMATLAAMLLFSR